MKDPAAKSAFVKNTAKDLGFDQCGIARAAFLEDDARRLENWLAKGMHGTMAYMADHFDLRTDPRKLVPGAKSVITLLKNYYPAEKQAGGVPLVAKYAYGEDYHSVIREKLNTFLIGLKNNLGDINGRGFVDSAPVLERAWAVRSGLGWVGRNGNLIRKDGGSFFFIAALIVDVELAADDFFDKDFCGTCTRCVDECPTQAILPGKAIDANKCISYLTIEYKNEILPAQFKGRTGDWIFGCDVCQDVCPWNRFSGQNTEPRFEPLRQIMEFGTDEWHALDEEAFKKIFRLSPLKRAKWKGIKRNLNFISPHDEPVH